MEKWPATVRGRYMRQIRGKMAPIKGRLYNERKGKMGRVKGRRYEKFAGSEDPRVNPAHADAVEKQSDILE